MRRESTATDDRLDEVLAEIERARHEPAWVPEPERAPRRLVAPPEALEGARWAPSRPALALIGLCAALALGILGVRLLLAPERQPQPVIDPAASSSLQVSGAGSVAASPTGAAAPIPASSTARVTGAAALSSASMRIHVVGAVASPGVVEVPGGSRVADAVKAAGGVKGANLEALNLARALSDGEQVHVPRPGESPTPVGSGAGTSPAAPGAGSGGASAASGAVVNLNSADLTALDALPGVGPVLAQRIIDWRTEHGRFSSVDELGEVSGIGDKALERLRSKVSV